MAELVPDAEDSPPVCIGVGVLVWREQQLLLGQRITNKQPDCWQFPGGWLEVGESVTACARREVQEETGLSIKKLRHLGFTNSTFTVAQKTAITLLVSCDYDTGSVEMREPDKCASWHWFDCQQLPSPLFTPINLFLAQISANPDVVATQQLYALHCAALPLTDTPLNGHK